jgi:shikimate dehydrogenase
MPAVPSDAPGGPTGATRVAAVIGDPVRHSLSPTLHNAAFGATGLDWVFVALPTAPDRGEAAVRSMSDLGLAGLSVTMPHKQAAWRVVDERIGDAARLGAVNCVVHVDGRLEGHNTDGVGFLASLGRAGWDGVADRACLVVGAGGAARAVVAALAGAGAADVAVLARTPERGEQAAALAGSVGRVVGQAAITGAELIVDATPAGMAGQPRAAFDVDLIRPGQLVVDLVYEPTRTELIEAAAERGAVTLNGVGMLVHQAAAAFQLWTGIDAPVEAMEAAVSGSLGAG